MAKTRVCEDLFMRPGCGRQFRARRFSRARQCPSCTSGFLTAVGYVDQSGAGRIYDLGLFGRRASVLAGGSFADLGLWRGLNEAPEVYAAADFEPAGPVPDVDFGSVSDADLAVNLGRHVGLFMPALPPSGLVLDGAAVSDDYTYEN